MWLTNHDQFTSFGGGVGGWFGCQMNRLAGTNEAGCCRLSLFKKVSPAGDVSSLKSYLPFSVSASSVVLSGLCHEYSVVCSCSIGAAITATRQRTVRMRKIYRIRDTPRMYVTTGERKTPPGMEGL